MNNANARMKGCGCPLKARVVNEQPKETVKNTFGYPSAILQFNGVENTQELWSTEKTFSLDCSHD